MLSITRKLRADRRGVAAIEFAYVLPLLMILIFYGLEMVNFAITRERVSELAMQMADNASRIGAQDTLSNKPITEAQINDTFIGSALQGGDIDVEANGRIILSSLEMNADKGQWIHWQRCFGNKSHPSSYGNEDDGKTGTGFPGMGPPATRVTAPEGMAVMFVEISLNYKPLITSYWAPATEVKDIATFNVRDDRDLSQIYNPEAVKASRC